MDIFEEMQRDKEIILNCDTIEQYKASSLTRVPSIYGEYARFERCFNTIKNHPDIHLSKELFLPSVHKASELFAYYVLMHDGVGRQNEQPRVTGTIFISDLHCEHRPINTITEAEPKEKGKPWTMMYVKPIYDDSEVKGMYMTLGAYELAERTNAQTGKPEWLVILNDRNMIFNAWLAVINEWDIKENKL